MCIRDRLEQGASILNSIITGITDTIPTLVDMLPQIITTITTAITDCLLYTSRCV